LVFTHINNTLKSKLINKNQKNMCKGCIYNSKYITDDIYISNGIGNMCDLNYTSRNLRWWKENEHIKNIEHIEILICYKKYEKKK